MKTVDYYKKAIARALNAMEGIQRANAAYKHDCEVAKGAYEADLLGQKGYEDRLAELAAERDTKIESE